MSTPYVFPQDVKHPTGPGPATTPYVTEPILDDHPYPLPPGSRGKDIEIRRGAVIHRPRTGTSTQDDQRGRCGEFLSKITWTRFTKHP